MVNNFSADVMRKLGIALIAIFLSSASAATEYRAETVVGGLKYPWSIAFLPNGDAFVTEKVGRLRVIRNGELDPEPIKGLPPIRVGGQGGLMGVALHPNFATNKTLCLSYTGGKDNDVSTEVACGEIDAGALTNLRTIFVAEPRSSRFKHFGGRLIFDDNGVLYATLGDRGERPSAQDNSKHNGALIRIDLAGKPIADNPFVGTSDARPEIFSMGHRNMQGIAIHPVTKAIWTHEHGPQGGDEVNVNRIGKNYGWPVITYGANYGFGTKIGEGVAKPGMEQPLHKWVPSIAPSGMMFYSGKRVPDWQNNVFVGSLKFGFLVRLEFNGDKFANETRYFDGEYGGIRDVAEGPDGHIYFLTVSRKGRLMRLVEE